MTKQGQDPQGQELIVDGQVITTRKQCQELIEIRARENDITHDEAWRVVQAEIVRYRSDPELSPRAKAVSPQTAAPPGVTQINGNTADMAALLSNDHDLSDVLITGKVIEGEHPAARLLRKTIPKIAGVVTEDVALLRAEAELAKEQLRTMGVPVQYPLFRSTERIMPNDLLRTSLFHATSNNVPRRYCKNEKLGSVGSGVTIYYTGLELRQTDEAMFRQLLMEARGLAPWDWISLTQCRFLKAAKNTDRHLSSEDNNSLSEIILRMRSGVLLIQSKRRGAFVTCNLLEGYEGEEREQLIRFDPRIVLLFDSYSVIDESVLTSLKGAVQKIYGYLATVPHSELYPISIRNLFETCYGVTEYLVRDAMVRNPKLTMKEAQTAVAKKYSDFLRKNLRKALEILRDDTRVIASFEIDFREEKVMIVKKMDMWGRAIVPPLETTA